MSAFKHLTYDEWIAEHPEILQQEEDCPECNGDGETTCDHCGSVVSCEVFNGTGKTKSAHAAYQIQKDLDDKMMSNYLARVSA